MIRSAKIVTCVFLVSVLIFAYKYNTSFILQYNTSLQYDLPKDPNLKHILLWTSEKTEPFVFIGLGQDGFIRRNCSYTNCYVTPAKRYFGDYRKFHAVVFAMSEAAYYRKTRLPLYRAPEQKFVFSSIESSHYYPACSNRFDGYFNWSWSFRLDSDCRWEYIAIRDANKNVIGPKTIMHWMDIDNMKPVSRTFQKSLRTKTKAVAWFVSNCVSKSRREEYVEKLKTALAKHNHTVDIYGECGPLKCSRRKRSCKEIIKDDYYFYLAFENSFSEDYVTEKLLTALNYNAVPIVYGQANYTRFMPDGIYLNAREWMATDLAEEIAYLIKSPKKYAKYFRWKKYYSYHSRSESPDTDDICAFCALLNDEEKFKQKSVIQNFRKWWDNPSYC